MSQQQHLFLLAAGSGVTPVFSLLKTTLHRFPQIRVVLVYSNHSEEDTIFYSALRELQIQYSKRLKIEWLYSNAADHTKARLSNWLLGELLKKYLTAALTDCLFYCCGPFNFMRMITITLLSAGAKNGAIRKEEFVIIPPGIQTQPPDTKCRQVFLLLNKEQYEFSCVYPQTNLQAARQAGLELPYSCETGRCGTCAAVCSIGNVWMKFNEVLTDEDIQNKRVLTCTGYPVYGNVVLDFDEI